MQKNQIIQNIKEEINNISRKLFQIIVTIYDR